MTFRAIPFVLGLLACGCGPKFISEAAPGVGGSAPNDDGDAGEGGSRKTSQGGADSANGSTAGAAGSGGAGAVASAGGAGAAAGGGAAGTSPSGGAAGACVEPRAEVCDGVDNDCDGLIDSNCEATLTCVLQQQLQALGDPNGGGAYGDDCPRGQVLGGLQVRMSSRLTQIQGICRELSVTLNTAGASGYALTLSAAPLLPAHPATSTDAISTLLCDATEALVGLRAALEEIPFGSGKATIITRLWVSCSKLVVVQRANGAKVIEADPAIRELAPACASTPSANALLATSMAPAGSLPTRLFGASGLWVDRVGLGVSEIQLVQ